MFKVFITGIAGFIGSHLAERLIAQGHKVSGIDNLSSGKAENIVGIKGINFYNCDCRNLAKLKCIISEVKPDFIYHLAATVGVKRVLDDPKECIENNIDSTRNILGFGIPGIYASTSEVYGKTDKVLSENAPLIYSSKSRWSYAASKLIGEYLVQATKGWKSVRFFNVVGPRQSSSYGAVLPTFVKQSLDKKKLTVYGNGKQVRTFIDVRDCSEILDRLKDKYFDVVNIGGNTVLSIYDLAVAVIECTSSIIVPSNYRIETVTYKDAYPEGFEECTYRVPSLGKLESLLPVVPSTSLKKTILDLAESIKKEKGHEQIRQHEPDVAGIKTGIPRLTGNAIR